MLAKRDFCSHLAFLVTDNVPVFSNVNPHKPLWGSPQCYPGSRIASSSRVQSTGRRPQQAQAGLKGAHHSCKSPLWGQGLTCSLRTEASSAQATAANPPTRGQTRDSTLPPPSTSHPHLFRNLVLSVFLLFPPEIVGLHGRLHTVMISSDKDKLLKSLVGIRKLKPRSPAGTVSSTTLVS